MDRLKYMSTERLFEGIIIELNDCAVTIDLEGRMGHLRVPRRLLICENEPVEGQKVGFLMSYPEVIDEKVYEDHLQSAKEQLKKKKDRGDLI